MLTRICILTLTASAAVSMSACTNEEIDDALNGMRDSIEEQDKTVAGVPARDPNLAFDPNSQGLVRYCRRPMCTDNVQVTLYLSGAEIDSAPATEELNSNVGDARTAGMTVTFDFPNDVKLLADSRGITDMKCSGRRTDLATAAHVEGLEVGRIENLKVTYETTVTIADQTDGTAHDNFHSHSVAQPGVPAISYNIDYDVSKAHPILCDDATVRNAVPPADIRAALESIFNSAGLRNRLTSDLNSRLRNAVRDETGISQAEGYRAHVFINDKMMVTYAY